MKPRSHPAPLTPARQSAITALLHAPEVERYVREVNRFYYSWEQVRHRPRPHGLTDEEAWWLVTLSRMGRRSLPLRDVNGAAFGYWVTDFIQQTLHLIDRLGRGGLAMDADDPTVLAEMRERVVLDSLMEEAIATSQIEGAVTTRMVAKEMLRSGRAPRGRSEQMIMNGYQTIRLLRERINRPLSVEVLHEIQRSMTHNTLDRDADAGRFRTARDDVHAVDTRDNEIVYTPPPARLLKRRMGAMIRFANADASDEPFIHPLIRAAILHFWMAYEHPYVDGNGRTARALFYWSMLRSGYGLFEFLTISRIIHASPGRYYRAFIDSERHTNDLTYFLAHQVSVTAKAVEDLHRRLRDMSLQQQRIRASRLGHGLNPRQRALLDHAVRHPAQVYTFESHQGSHGISYQTARTDVLGLLDKKLLVETGALRPREFMASENLSNRLKKSD